MSQPEINVLLFAKHRRSQQNEFEADFVEQSGLVDSWQSTEFEFTQMCHIVE